MSSIAIITDTDASRPAEVAARYGIRHCCGTGGHVQGRDRRPGPGHRRAHLPLRRPVHPQMPGHERAGRSVR